MSIRAKPTFSLKDSLFNLETVGQLGVALKSAYPDFDRRAFEREVVAAFPGLELKERISWMAVTLGNYLPNDFSGALVILQDALPPPLDPAKTDGDFGEFIWVVPGEYVARHGCTREHLADSLNFLREATKRVSSENAIRPFLISFPEETLAFIHACTGDDNYHVRRLASEGIRPFLPWAPRVKLPVADVITVLDKLHGDPTRYVTRSVANTLNDLSRINVSAVVRALKRWRSAEQQEAGELDWMTRHALRTLLRQDHPQALQLLGYTRTPRFRLSRLTTTEVVRVGENLRWQCRLTSEGDQKLKVTLRLHFLKGNGKHSAKTFAVFDGHFKKGETVDIDKRQPFKPITTRSLYPGTHYAELVVNGVASKRKAFELLG